MAVVEDPRQMVTYCGCKISKVRWAPVSSGQKVSDIFVSGSTDNDMNTVNLWKFSYKKGEGQEPKMVSEAPVSGSVMDIEWTRDLSSYGTPSSAFLVATDTGGLEMYSTGDNWEKLSLLGRWPGLHRGACSSVAHNSERGLAVTGGEDGDLCVLQTSSGKEERRISGATSGAIHAVKFYKSTEVAVASSFGTLTITDVRSSDKTSLVLCLPNSSGLSCLDNHPGQPYILATGGTEGSIMFWDVRGTKRNTPVKVLSAHSGSVWDLRFHPTQPNNLFTCSQDGSIWLWRETEDEAWPSYDTGSYVPQRGLPVNSVDIESAHLIGGTDGEAIFIYPNCVSW